MKRTSKIACTTVSLVATLACSAARAAEDKIRFKFPARLGETSRAAIVVKVVGQMQMPSPMPAQKFSQSIEQEWVETCRQVNPDGSAIYDMQISQYATKMSAGGQTIEFDSRTYDPDKPVNPFAELLGQILAPITSAKFTLTVGADGRPVKFEGLAKALDEAIEAAGKQAESGPGQKMLHQMRGLFDDDIMMQHIETTYRLIPPNNEGRIGDTWEHKWTEDLPSSFPGPGIQCTGRFELAGVETIGGRKCAKTRFQGTYQSAPQSEATSQAAADDSLFQRVFRRLQLDMRASKYEGVGYWDYQNGAIVKYRETTNLTIRIKLDPDPEAEDEDLKQGFGPILQRLRITVSLDQLEYSPDGSKTKAVASAPADPEP